MIASKARNAPRGWRRLLGGERPDPTDAALASAERLEARGEHFEAIQLLSAANRRRRDPRLEAKLLDLRFSAYEHSEWPTEPPAWPDSVEDLFPGAVIPEITRGELTVERVRSAMVHHGSLLVRGLISPRHVRLLIDDIDEVFIAYDRLQASRKPVDGEPWVVASRHEPSFTERKFRRDAGGVLAVDSPPALFDVIEAFEAVGIGRLVREYFGERPAILAKKWTLRRVPHNASPSDWHQDGAFMGERIRSLNVWLPLTHCGDDAPGIDVVGRKLTSVVETGTDGAFLKWTVGPGAVERVAQGTVVRPIFEPGDVLLFDHLNLHRTAVDSGMTRDRYAIEAWFFAPSTYAAMMAADDGRDPAVPKDQVPIAYAGATE